MPFSFFQFEFVRFYINKKARLFAGWYILFYITSSKITKLFINIKYII